MIHPTAIVDPKAEITDGVEIGPYCIIEGDVLIGEGTKIGPHVVIREGTRIGKRCQIFQFASVGEVPQSFAYQGEKTYLLIGDQNIIRECVTLHRGTQQGKGKTVIGNDNFFMAYSMWLMTASSEPRHHGEWSRFGGHILIEDHAIIGGWWQSTNSAGSAPMPLSAASPVSNQTSLLTRWQLEVGRNSTAQPRGPQTFHFPRKP